MGLGKGLCLPFTKKYDGKDIKFEVSKQFLSGDNKLDVDVHSTVTPQSGKNLFIKKCYLWMVSLIRCMFLIIIDFRSIL